MPPAIVGKRTYTMLTKPRLCDTGQTIELEGRERVSKAISSQTDSIIVDLEDAVAPCACRKSNPDILVVQPAENWAAKNVPGPLDGARDRRILLQG